MSLSSFIKRFTMGAAVGLFVATICWADSADFYLSVSLIQGIIAILLSAITCGMLAVKVNVNRLLKNLLDCWF